MTQTKFSAGDVVKVAVDYDDDGKPVLIEGRILLKRPGNHPQATSWVAEIDVGSPSPKIAYLHDLVRWNS